MATPRNRGCRIAWKYLYTAKDSWLGATADLGAIGAMYNLTMDPYEKYDMTFNGAASTRRAVVIAGQVCGLGQRLGPWRMFYQMLLEFDKSIVKYPSIRRVPGGASNDLVPNLKDSGEPPALRGSAASRPQVGGGGG